MTEDQPEMAGEECAEGRRGEVPAELPAGLAKMVSVAREDEEKPFIEPLQELANEERAVLLAFIAPYAGVRISPVEVRGATIGFAEEFSVEQAIKRIRSETDCPRLFLLVNSPGGITPSSYKIARLLRTVFDEIVTFIVHVAASGGALLAIAGNRIVMGPMSHLTPIDPQVAHGGGMVSCTAILAALSRLSDFFRTRLPQEAPYPWKAMADKLDPVLLEDWNSSLVEAERYVQEILCLAGYSAEAADAITSRFVRLPDGTHSFVIHRERAAEYGLNVELEDGDQERLEVMRSWLAQYMLREAAQHVIRYVVPKKGGGSAHKSEGDKEKEAERDEADSTAGAAKERVLSSD